MNKNKKISIAAKTAKIIRACIAFPADLLLSVVDTLEDCTTYCIEKRSHEDKTCKKIDKAVDHIAKASLLHGHVTDNYKD